MRKTRMLVLFFTLSSFTMVAFNNASANRPEVSNAKGLKEMTPQELAELRKKRIKKVNPNKLAIKRINDKRAEQGLPPIEDTSSQQPEFEMEAAGATTSTSTATATSTGLAQVDNSALPSFPLIGNQGNQGSCVGWATTYYLMSHEVCLTLGCNNKTSSSRVFSPRWTYNLINSGVDGGSYFSDAFKILSQHGAAQMAEFPYTASEFRSWSLNTDHWRNAIRYRMSAFSSFLVNTDSGIATLKQTLANGHVVVIGTYITSWQYSTIKANPNAASNPFVGQSVVTHINGTLGAHAMTVVGYDDSIWTDLNQNGIVESAELGAFKIANSWGASWGNAGYMWASYDAFRSSSALAGYAPTGRIQLTQSAGGLISTYTPYNPKLLAKVTMSHSLRHQLSVNFGTSSLSTLTPQTYWTPAAFRNSGGGYAFNGTTAEVEGTFYFDLSNLVTTGVDQQLFYVIMNDNLTQNYLTVRSFQLIDPVTDVPLYAAGQVPLAVDAATNRLIAGNYTPDTTAPTVPSNFKAVWTIKRQGNKKITVASLSWTASSDNKGVAKYYIYRNNVKIAESTSLNFTDANTVVGSSYTYQVSAVDGSGNESNKSISVTLVR